MDILNELNYKSPFVPGQRVDLANVSQSQPLIQVRDQIAEYYTFMPSKDSYTQLHDVNAMICDAQSVCIKGVKPFADLIAGDRLDRDDEKLLYDVSMTSIVTRSGVEEIKDDIVPVAFPHRREHRPRVKLSSDPCSRSGMAAHQDDGLLFQRLLTRGRGYRGVGVESRSAGWGRQTLEDNYVLFYTKLWLHYLVSKLHPELEHIEEDPDLVVVEEDAIGATDISRYTEYAAFIDGRTLSPILRAACVVGSSCYPLTGDNLRGNDIRLPGANAAILFPVSPDGCWPVVQQQFAHPDGARLALTGALSHFGRPDHFKEAMAAACVLIGCDAPVEITLPETVMRHTYKTDPCANVLGLEPFDTHHVPSAMLFAGRTVQSALLESVSTLAPRDVHAYTRNRGVRAEIIGTRLRDMKFDVPEGGLWLLAKNVLGMHAPRMALTEAGLATEDLRCAIGTSEMFLLEAPGVLIGGSAGEQLMRMCEQTPKLFAGTFGMPPTEERRAALAMTYTMSKVIETQWKYPFRWEEVFYQDVRMSAMSVRNGITKWQFTMRLISSGVTTINDLVRLETDEITAACSGIDMSLLEEKEPMPLEMSSPEDKIVADLIKLVEGRGAGIPKPAEPSFSILAKSVTDWKAPEVDLDLLDARRVGHADYMESVERQLSPQPKAKPAPDKKVTVGGTSVIPDLPISDKNDIPWSGRGWVCGDSTYSVEAVNQILKEKSCAVRAVAGKPLPSNLAEIVLGGVANVAKGMNMLPLRRGQKVRALRLPRTRWRLHRTSGVGLLCGQNSLAHVERLSKRKPGSLGKLPRGAGWNDVKAVTDRHPDMDIGGLDDNGVLVTTKNDVVPKYIVVRSGSLAGMGHWELIERTDSASDSDIVVL